MCIRELCVVGAGVGGICFLHSIFSPKYLLYFYICFYGVQFFNMATYIIDNNDRSSYGKCIEHLSKTELLYLVGEQINEEIHMNE